MEFRPDPQVQKLAEAYSLDMLDFAKQNFAIVLDWSDRSVADVEKIAGQLHKSLGTHKPSQEQIDGAYKMVGSYIGEVFRRNHKCEWGWLIRPNEENYPALRGGKRIFWPWGKAYGRITKGPDDDLLYYFQSILASMK